MQVGYQRYFFNFILRQPLDLNCFSGAKLRGSFGHALKSETCAMKTKVDCPFCLLKKTCAYPMIFASESLDHHLQTFSHKPVPYVIEPPSMGERYYLAGELFRFSMVLSGNAINSLGVIIKAWIRTFLNEKNRLHYSQKIFDGILISVSYKNNAHFEKIIYDDKTQQLNEHCQTVLIPEKRELQFAHLRFTTPLRLVKKGKLINQETLNAKILLISLIKRINLLNEIYNKELLIKNIPDLVIQSEQITLRSELIWQDWQRYSNKQKKTIPQGGLKGNIVLQGKLDEFLPWLYLGQWLHIGKNTNFGLGRYYLSE